MLLFSTHCTSSYRSWCSQSRIPTPCLKPKNQSFTVSIIDISLQHPFILSFMHSFIQDISLIFSQYFTPDQLRPIYGIQNSNTLGAGKTIAIIDAYGITIPHTSRAVSSSFPLPLSFSCMLQVLQQRLQTSQCSAKISNYHSPQKQTSRRWIRLVEPHILLMTLLEGIPLFSLVSLLLIFLTTIL